MRYLIIVLFGTMVFFSCKKSDGNSAPKIKFKSITPLINTISVPKIEPIPILTIQVSDDDGDIGFKDGFDTSYIYIKNLTVAPFKIDSFKFPSQLSAVPKGTFKAYQDVEINLNGNRTPGNVLVYQSSGPSPSPRKDTAFYEVYVKDFGKNKSNIIRTDDPIVLITR